MFVVCIFIVCILRFGYCRLYQICRPYENQVSENLALTKNGFVCPGWYALGGPLLNLDGPPS